MKNNKKTHPHIFFSGNVISQTCGQIVPTPRGNILHASRASHLPYDAENLVFRNTGKYWQFIWKSMIIFLGVAKIGSPNRQLDYLNLATHIPNARRAALVEHLEKLAGWASSMVSGGKTPGHSHTPEDAATVAHIYILT